MAEKFVGGSGGGGGGGVGWVPSGYSNASCFRVALS